jgi:hypothetical protein
MWSHRQPLSKPIVGGSLQGKARTSEIKLIVLSISSTSVVYELKPWGVSGGRRLSGCPIYWRGQYKTICTFCWKFFIIIAVRWYASLDFFLMLLFLQVRFSASQIYSQTVFYFVISKKENGRNRQSGQSTYSVPDDMWSVVLCIPHSVAVDWEWFLYRQRVWSSKIQIQPPWLLKASPLFHARSC